MAIINDLKDQGSADGGLALHDEVVYGLTTLGTGCRVGRKITSPESSTTLSLTKWKTVCTEARHPLAPNGPLLT